MQDVGIEFGKGTCESVATQVVTTELADQERIICKQLLWLHICRNYTLYVIF